MTSAVFMGEPVEPVPLHGDDLEREKDRLAALVLEDIGTPIDTWAVAAALEIAGLRDFDAGTRFGAWDLFDLADDVYARCMTRRDGKPPPVGPVRARPRRTSRLTRFARLYAAGAFFIFPLAIQLAALLVLGYSQWASIHFTARQASIVVFAVISGFVVTAGFVQALGYLGPLFLEPGEYVRARRLVIRTLLLGLLLTFVVADIAWIVNVAANAYPNKDIGIGLVYYVLVAFVSLANAALYMLRKFLAMVVSTVVGLGVVALIVEQTSWSIYAAHWTSLGVSVLVALGWVWVTLWHRERKTRGVPAPTELPRLAYLGYLGAPFFTYGILYFGLLFADRLVAWTTGHNPLPVWFRPAYEVGLDWALVALVLGIALLEYTVNAFSGHVLRVQQEVDGARIREHNRRFVRFYCFQLGVLALLAAAGIALVYEGGVSLRHVSFLHKVGEFFADSATRGVFVAGAIGYALIAWGLLNSLFLLSLSRPKLVLRAIFPAVLGSLAVGIPLSRTYPYWYAAAGLAAGGLVFAAVSGWYVVRTLSRADYFYFAAY
ncbi:MAG: hypothetical protein H0W87_07820 [Actinobacteria bacterium]|nr:hypothetical protein [Actinomycetota bacterium]